MQLVHIHEKINFLWIEKADVFRQVFEIEQTRSGTLLPLSPPRAA